MYCEGGQRGRLGRSDCINLKLLAEFTHFFFTFLQHEKAYSHNF